jgi:hypothetical protein
MIFLLIARYYLNYNHIVAYVNQGREVRSQKSEFRGQKLGIRGKTAGSKPTRQTAGKDSTGKAKEIGNRKGRAGVVRSKELI